MTSTGERHQRDPDHGPSEGIHFITKTGRRLRLQYGPYRVKRVIGEGGMGAIVLEAEDTEKGIDVALKVFSPDRRMTHEMRRRFIRGARASADIDHPNVVKILATGEESGRPYFAMELVRGATLDSVLREEGRLPPHRAVDLILQAARGLQAAAAQGVIHQDVKPQNVLVSEDGQAKITDFGIATIEQQESIFLQPGIIVGTPDYMSPEMCQAEAVDHRSDIYSLGISFYETLWGKPPFHGSPVDVMYKHSHKRPKNITRRVPTVHPRIARIAMRMISKNPAARYADYESLISDLEEVQKRGLFTTRSRRRPGLLSAITAGVGVGLLWGLHLAGWWEPFGGEAETAHPGEQAPRLQLVDGGFEGDTPPGLDPTAAGGWRVLATGPAAAEPQQIVVASLDDSEPAGGAQCLRMEVTAAQALEPSDVAFTTPWCLSTRFDGVKAYEEKKLRLGFRLRGSGERPRIVLRFAEEPERDTPAKPHTFSAGDSWEDIAVSFAMEPSHEMERSLMVRFFVAGAPGDVLWLDDVVLEPVEEPPARPEEGGGSDPDDAND